MNFKDKKILIGISGGIAAYKIASLVSRLSQEGAEVHVIMTEHACEFISPLTMETLSGQKCCTDTFDRSRPFEVEHIEVTKDADLYLIAPATANVIAKVACGIADDMLTTTFLAADCPKMVAPAMNTRMYSNQITQDNLDRLRKYEIEVIDPMVGHLACGDTGAGKMPSPEDLYAAMERRIARKKDLAGKRVLVTAGATCESMDPVRFITNHSSGKMGFAMAKECMLRGAEVILVKAATTATPPQFCQIAEAKSAEELFKTVKRLAVNADVVIMAAAVADYTPAEYVDHKVKKKDGELSVELKRTVDILAHIGARKRPEQFFCGFSMETENLIENSTAKLQKKNLDMIIANSLVDAGSGFQTDTNKVTIIRPEGVERCELMSKEMVAKTVIDRIADEING
ncbi:bifunctional phosphopantothenoylcysteine decarboxylase/phosphopantothenate--cysteine ligase CoaBC [Eubacterium sp. AB3007]|uniref:bifunctional phosphopantothenoylcysteine decarboxylase/phosphopantothenate--cysteine ligase CoaBC n=1 Tax=Eubacterium sp. AB3007 TaxID=1392487 RepID=UPI0004886356|nr:bifunctional phosphopantothenoylcysteine decarboxylase/phosphopantothenate--cysteine ligase CoaBC [Eubacterium sp. AB3007]